MLHYNENKIETGEASLIMASGFAGDIETLRFGQKLNRFNRLLQLKPNVKTNAVHISLNFHSSESPKQEQLQQIAASYLEKIGFGEQPYLVYRHHDAAHCHLHIVTTNITREAERIDLHNIGKRLSEPARKAIEEEFGLVKAESKDLKHYPVIKKADTEKVQYGHLPTKRAISNVLTAVLRDYRFTSLAEYDAVLGCFNVMAFRGEEHTAMYQKKGLMYNVTDGKGQPVGVPVKASSFYTKPTLRNLETLFGRNNEKRKPYRQDLRNRIDRLFNGYYTLSKDHFQKIARQQGIEVLYRQNEQGQLFGVTFVDHQSRCVFNGSDLGKAYSAKGLSERFSAHTRSRQELPIPTSRPANRAVQPENQTDQGKTPHTEAASLLETLLAKTQPDYGPGVPKRKKRKKNQQQLTL